MNAEIFTAFAGREPKHGTFNCLNIITANVLDMITSGKGFAGHVRPAASSV